MSEVAKIEDDYEFENSEENYIRHLEMSVELLKREIEHLRSKEKPANKKNKSKKNEAQAPVNNFLNCNNIQEIMKLFIDTILKQYPISETDLYLFDTFRKLYSAADSSASDALNKYKNNFEENGIIDWVCSKSSASAVPNFDDLSGESTNTSFLLIPLVLRDLAIGVIIAGTSKLPTDFSELELKFLFEQAVPATVAVDNLISKEEIVNMNRKLSSINKQMIESSKMASFGEIASSISGEISNSIKIIQANIDLIESGVGSPENRFKIIKQQIESINVINKRLINLSSTSTESKGSSVNLISVIDDILLFSNTQFQRDGIILQKEIEEGEFKIFGSKAQLEQAILNILLFSRDNLDEGGKIKIGLYRSRAEKLNLIISDSSIGLSPDELKDVFEPLVSDQNKSRTGLYLAKNIISQHKGKIEIISELRKGITYKISLPKYNNK